MLEGDRNMVVSEGEVDTWLRGLVPNLGEVLLPFMASQRGRFPHIFWQLEQKKEGGFYLCSSYSSCSFTRLVCDDMRQYG